MSFEENFLYPFYLILTGGAVSGGLVPIMKHYIDWKEKKRDIEREERHLAFERQREDHKHEIEFKDLLIKKINNVTSEAQMTLFMLAYEKYPKEGLTVELKKKWYESLGRLSALNNELLGISRLYFGDVTISQKYYQMFEMLISLSLLVLQPSNEIADKLFRSISKIDSKITKEFIRKGFYGDNAEVFNILVGYSAHPMVDLYFMINESEMKRIGSSTTTNVTK